MNSPNRADRGASPASSVTVQASAREWLHMIYNYSLAMLYQPTKFKCGVALLYCFFATPPHLRSAAYRLPEVSEAVRACSIILSTLAERWSQSRCLRDAFDILAREIPLFEQATLEEEVGPRKMGKESADALNALLGQLEVMPIAPRFFQPNISGLGSEGFDYAALGFPGDFGVSEILQPVFYKKYGQIILSPTKWDS
ncbi:hypothetical protein LY76DRAFT_605016 [Colletotrichum caudatum]|nr:hypothetical protein LY76DRAFT_605016 [Colletotrichum caudatum]